MNKKIPERKCLGCNARKQKNELIRVVRLKDGEVVLDKTGKVSGRGAYICPDINCYNKARKAKRFETNLEIAIPEEIYNSLAKKLEEDEKAGN
ncbi:MAG: YlxR family protein [Clostridia bacterium]|nr:YlxR family protein [Clostridia bacterium]